MQIIRTQINKDGSVSVWNTMKDTKKHKQYYIVNNSKGVSESHLKRLNELREFNKLAEKLKLLYKDRSIVKHVPGEKGNCLAI